MKDKENPNQNKSMNNFHQQASEILGEEFWQEMAGLIPNTGPRIDIYYTSTTVVVLVEVPALQSPDQIRILLEGQKLLIEGEIPCVYPVTDNRITLRERFFGNFRRYLDMPQLVSTNDIKARYTKGLLIIEFQIEQSTKQTHIPIDFP